MLSSDDPAVEFRHSGRAILLPSWRYHHGDELDDDCCDREVHGVSWPDGSPEPGPVPVAPGVGARERRTHLRSRARRVQRRRGVRSRARRPDDRVLDCFRYPGPCVSAAPTPEPSATVPYLDRSGNAAKGFLTSSTSITDGFGTYNPLVLDPHADLLQTDRILYKGPVNEWYDDATVNRAKKAVMTFLLESWLDSEATFDPSPEARARAEAIGRAVLPPVHKYTESYTETFTVEDHFMFDNSPFDILEYGFAADYPEGGARIRVDDLRFESIEATEERLYFEIPVALTRQYGNLEGEPELMQFTSTYRFVVVPDRETGMTILYGWDRKNSRAETIKE
ncbi:hypothetical protein [Sanguibacter massiliensis]|uniref:hypothetical protein n=1 Tax=Sanguibacter massiliensis TaxID=1973217 RepID=UPI000C81B0C1|nr:hypothetical protein [Sanguibacter massiliensis]